MSISVDAARERLCSIAEVIARVEAELLEIKRGLPESPCEHSVRDLDSDPSVPTEMRAVIDCVLNDSLEPAIRDLRDAAAYQPGGLLRTGIDLRLNSEETRQALYDLVVRDNFIPPPQQSPADRWVPPYTPEQAGLKVYYDHGRWFATWLKLEEPEELPEVERRELLVLAEAPDEPGRLVYRGV